MYSLKYSTRKSIKYVNVCSLHVANDENRKLSSRGITTKSGTTSLTNDEIQNKAQLTKCYKHNYKKYDMNQGNIVIVKGTDSVVKVVANLYMKVLMN